MLFSTEWISLYVFIWQLSHLLQLVFLKVTLAPALILLSVYTLTPPHPLFLIFYCVLALNNPIFMACSSCRTMLGHPFCCFSRASKTSSHIHITVTTVSIPPAFPSPTKHKQTNKKHHLLHRPFVFPRPVLNLIESLVFMSVVSFLLLPYYLPRISPSL